MRIFLQHFYIGQRHRSGAVAPASVVTRDRDDHDQEIPRDSLDPAVTTVTNVNVT